MKAPDKIYTDNRGVYAELPIFSQIDANVEYIRKNKIREMVMYARNMSQTPDAAIHNWDVLIKEIDKI